MHILEQILPSRDEDDRIFVLVAPFVYESLTKTVLNYLVPYRVEEQGLRNSIFISGGG
jgi:hypothetical protein